MRNLPLAAAVALLVFGLACDDDPVGGGGPPPDSFQDLSQRSHVLNNFELAYNRRNIAQYDKFLDTGFMFFFAPSDVGGGLPVSWGRATEIQAIANMFDPNYTGPARCKRIDMDLLFEDGVTWVPVNPASAPTETWYTTTVFYEFKIDTEPDNTWIAVPGARAQFTVRNAGTEGAPLWKLAELRDLGENNLLQALAAATESQTLGRIKALYD